MERLPEDTELDRCRKFVEFWEGCTQLQGLAQSNSNARLNNSAKHVAMLLETSVNVQRKQRWGAQGGRRPGVFLSREEDQRPNQGGSQQPQFFFPKLDNLK